MIQKRSMSMIKEGKKEVKDAKLDAHKIMLDKLYKEMCPRMKHMI